MTKTEANGPLVWDRDGADWPNRSSSQFIEAGGLRWHVQTAGRGPVVLLVHGTAASTHSWRDVLPLLATNHTVVAMDLPGHAFTSTLGPRGPDLTLPGMAQAIGALAHTLGLAPHVAVGHSAGAAILVRAVADGMLSPRVIISLNGALLPFRGLGRHLFPTLAQIMMLNPFTPDFFTWRASRKDAVRSLLENTGSRIDEHGLAIYQRLLSDRRHVASALAMMANWDLESLSRDLAGISVPLALVVGNADRAVPPDDAFEVANRVKEARVYALKGLGHLAHEEDPRRLSELVTDIAKPYVDAGVARLEPAGASPDRPRHPPG